VEQVWEAAKKAWRESCEEELGIAKNQSQPWISKQSLDKIEERKKIKASVNPSSPTPGNSYAVCGRGLGGLRTYFSNSLEDAHICGCKF